jgi:membrane protein YqaA with SNARE-associated domain
MMHDEMSPQRLIARLLVGLLALATVVGLLALSLEPQIRAWSTLFVAEFGLVGVFFAVIATDSLAATHEPVLLVAYAGGLGFMPVFLTASAASVIAGPVGWGLGTLLGRAPLVERVFRRYRIDDFMTRYGFWAVAVAALTPFPFSLATWASGAAGLQLRVVALGSLFRVPKVLFYFSLIVFGWDMFPSWIGI